MKDDFDNWLSERHDDGVAEDSRLAPGTVVGGFRVVDLLGRGGFAEVYKAQDEKGKAVAIKVLHRLDEKSRARFAREEEILSKIVHPNIPRLLGRGDLEGRPYMVTELLKGSELPAGDRRVAVFLRQIISAAAELHRQGYIHRDIKPANILAREDGTPVLIDFGLACPVSAVERERDALSIEDGRNVAVGTVGYSAPEQFSGRGAGPEADVHAVGSLIDACYDGNIPPCWRRIYLTATASNPKSRYQSMAELAKAIRNRHRETLWALAAVVALGVAGGLWALLGDKSRGARPDPPQEEVDIADRLEVVGPRSLPWMPSNDAEAVDGVSEIEATVKYRVDDAGRKKLEELKDEVGDFWDFWFEDFLDQELDDCDSEQIRRLCGDGEKMLGDFKPFVKAKLEEEFPDSDIKLEIRDVGFRPR